MSKEKKIYIRELFFKLLINWRKIIVWMIIFAVLANIVFCVKYYRALSASVEQNTSSNEEIDVQVYKDALSDDDAQDVETNFSMYLKHKDNYDKVINYCNESILMNLDPNNIPIVQMEYTVQNCDFSDDFVTTIKGQVQNDETAQKIIQELGINTESSYIWELIEFSSAEREDAQTDTAIIQNENSDSLMMLVQVMADDIESANTMAKILDKEIQNKVEKLKQYYGDVKIEKISQTETSIVNQDLLLRQQDYSVRLNNLKSYFENIKSSMTDGQKNYYNALIDDYENKTEAHEESDITITEEEKEAPVVTMRYFNIKYIILGAFLGFVLAACYILFPYVFGNKLQVSYEVSDNFGITLLGIIGNGDRKKKLLGIIDQKIYNFFRKDNKQISFEENIQMIGTKINIANEKENLRKIFITGTVETSEINIIKNQIADLISNKQIDVKIGDSILKDGQALKKLSETDGVILVEKTGDSILDDIYTEIELCKNYDVFVIGTVVLE